MLKCVVKKGIGKKSGNEYVALEITFPNGFKMMVFPKTSAERFIFEQFIEK